MPVTSLLIHLNVKLFQDGWLDFLSGSLSLGLSLRLSVSVALSLRDDLRIPGSFQEISNIIRNPLLTLDSDLGLELKQMAHAAFFLRDERH